MSKKKILLYYPPNHRSVAMESMCDAIHEAGYELIVLTLTKPGLFHEALEKKGIKTYTHILIRKNPWIYFWKHARYLAKFSREHRVDIVWSHLQEGNIISVIAQPFLKAKLVTFRHHAESAFYAEYGDQMGMKRSKREAFLDKIINRLARKIIVPSSGVWYGMEKYEKCNMRKVQLIPYIYNFSSYQKPDLQKVELLKNEYPCQLRLIMVSRMIPSKQHLPVFKIIKKLTDEGLSVRMIVMDEGPLKGELEKYIEENGLSGTIGMVGFRTDFINYMAASDMVIHPSLTEASNNVVKELALLEKTAAVCKNVGDFDDYIRDGENGFFIDRGNLEESLENVIRKAAKDPILLKKMGNQLKKDVLDLFSYSEKNRKPLVDLIENQR